MKQPHSSTHCNPLPNDLREALANPENLVEVAYIRKDRVAHAELHPHEVPALQDRVTFLVVGEAAQTYGVWQNDTACGLQRVTTGLSREEADSEMNRLAAEWPERTDIMDADQLRAYIVDNECAGHSFYDSVESVIGALGSKGGGAGLWLSTRLWAITETISGWAVWSVEDTDSEIHMEGVFRTEAEARKAAEDASDIASREWDIWLLQLAQDDFDEAMAAGQFKVAGDMQMAITHLRSCLKRA